MWSRGLECSEVFSTCSSDNFLDMSGMVVSLLSQRLWRQRQEDCLNPELEDSLRDMVGLYLKKTKREKKSVLL